jgi:hypothetical protein
MLSVSGQLSMDSRLRGNDVMRLRTRRPQTQLFCINKSLNTSTSIGLVK